MGSILKPKGFIKNGNMTKLQKVLNTGGCSDGRRKTKFRKDGSEIQSDL